MKKFVVIILAFMHLSASAGVTVHMHYCMGKLADWGLSNKESKLCAKCGMEKTVKKNNSCCKDEYTFIKDTTDQKTAESAVHLIQLAVVALPVHFFEIASVTVSVINGDAFNSHGPPEAKSIAVYIRHCSFLI
ncbi:MAG: hypothetical protein M0Q26_04915 [Chitinophagaceae bacterium]|nr:hypothetical protein [Chitinophagaceae bacterium]MDP1763307.1 hypothetical protein [Sediminibacterium sp.]MDP1812171.1 hypothetical protein [Sediminibacterium sp.]MDP3127090.1 hypothetical protein [Sediminibacterium sp.]MDP3666379.1 hypothetical protein [Sediminibacterium sp.]